MRLHRGTLFHDRYLLVSALGEGASADVWKAKDTKANNLTVALKIFAQHSEMDTYGLRDFEREFTTVYNMKHSNLLPPTGYDICGGRPYLVMQYCENGSCSSMKERMEEEDLLKFLHDVSAGLEYLHDHNIIHQDIKPDNILLDDNCNFMVTDFGISVSADRDINDSSSATGGTRAYMGPERFQGVTVNASDVWSLGATAYELFTGYPPFGEHGGLLQAQGEKIPDMSDLKLRPEVKDIIKSCLAEEPSKRIKANEIRQKIELYWDTGAWVRHSNKNVIAVSLTAAASVILCLGIYLWDYNRTKVYYYKDYAEYRAVPKGIGRLSINEMKHRDQSYRLEYSGHKLRRLSLVNSAGKVVPHTDSEYMVSRYSEVYYFYTDRGDVDYLTIYNEIGTLLYKMDYDENLKTATFRLDDEYGTEMCFDSNMNEMYKGYSSNAFADKSHISRYQLLYDENGLLTERRYVGFQNVPAPDKDNIYGQRYKYDKKGRKIEEAYIGIDGQLACNKDGLAIRVYEYGDDDDWVSVEYLAMDRNGSHDGNNCTLVKMEHDKYGNRIKESYFASDGKPSIRTDENVSGFTYKYNEKGFRVLTSAFGVDGEPAYTSHGFVSIRQEYDDSGYVVRQELLDENGGLVFSGSEECCSVETVRNDRGQELSRKFFDEFGGKCELLVGVHEYAFKYDNKGNMTEQWTYDNDGRPAYIDGFYCGQKYEYDEYSRMTRAYNVDEKGNICTEDGVVASSRVEYNRQGSVTKISFYGTDGKLVMTNNMYAGESYTYDEMGNTKTCQYFDAEEKPCANASGISKIEYIYDPETNLPTIEKSLNVSGKVISEDHYKYDSKGNEVESYTLQGNNLKSGTAVCRSAYDANNRTTAIWYCDLRGKKVRGPGVNYCEARFEYDQRGNCTQYTFWDADESPAVDDQYTHKRVHEYDALNRIVSEKSFGKDGKPLTGKYANPEGYQKYDKWGNVTELSCYDGYGKPRLNSRGVFVVKFQYNSRGQKICEEFLGVDGKLVLMEGEDYAKAEYAYDSHGNLTEENYYDTKKLFKTKKSRYNEKNKLVEECYYDGDGRQSDKFYGVSRMAVEYKDDGITPVSVKYYNQSGKMLGSQKWNKATSDWGEIVFTDR